MPPRASATTRSSQPRRRRRQPHASLSLSTSKMVFIHGSTRSANAAFTTHECAFAHCADTTATALEAWMPSQLGRIGVAGAYGYPYSTMASMALRERRPAAGQKTMHAGVAAALPPAAARRPARQHRHHHDGARPAGRPAGAPRHRGQRRARRGALGRLPLPSTAFGSAPALSSSTTHSRSPKIHAK